MDLLGYSVDPKLQDARKASPSGFVSQDKDLLKLLGMLVKKGGTWVINNDAGVKKSDFLDLFEWILRGKTAPFPPILKTILCIKRANLIGSISHSPTSNALRKDQLDLIAGIDKILKNAGVAPCASASKKSGSGYSVAGFGTPGVGTPGVGTPDVGTPGVGTPSSGTRVPCTSCDLSKVEKTISEINAKLDEMKRRPGIDHSAAFSKLETQIRSLLDIITSGLAEQGRAFDEKLGKLAKLSGSDLDSSSLDLSSSSEDVDFEDMVLKISQLVDGLSALRKEFNKLGLTGRTTLYERINQIEDQLRPLIQDLPEDIPAIKIKLGTLENSLDTILGYVQNIPSLRGIHDQLLPLFRTIYNKDREEKADIDRQLVDLRRLVSGVPGLTQELAALTAAHPANHAAVLAAIAQLQAAIEARPAAPLGAAPAVPGEALDQRCCDEIRAAIAAIQAQLNDVPKRADLAGLDATLTNIQQRLDELDEQLEDLPSMEAIEAAINAQLNTIQPLLQALQPLVAELAGARENIRGIRAAIGDGDRSVRNTLAEQTAQLAAMQQQLTALHTHILDPARIARQEQIGTDVTDILRRLTAITAPDSQIFQPILAAIEAAQMALEGRIAALERPPEAGAVAGAAAPPAENPELAELRRQLADLQRIQLELNQQIRIKTETEATLRRELDECRAALERLTANSAAASDAQRAEQEALQRRINDLETELRARADTIRTGESTVARLEREAEALRDQIRVLQEDLERTNKAWDRESSGFREQIERVQANLRDCLEGRAANAAASEEARRALEAAIAESQRALEQAQADLERLRAEAAAAVAAGGAATADLQARLDEAQARVEATREFGAITEQLAQAQQRLAECERSRAELEAQMARNRAEANARHAAELARVRREAEQARRARNDQYRRELREAEENFRRTQDALNDEYRKEAEAARRQCGEIRDRTIAEKDAEIARVRAELEERLAQCEERRAAAETAQRTAQARITELEANRATANTEAGNLRTQLREAEAAQAAQRARIEALERDCAGAAAAAPPVVPEPPPAAVPAAVADGDFVPATETMNVTPEIVSRTTCIPNAQIETAVASKFARSSPEERTQISNMLKDLNAFSCDRSPMASAAARLYLGTLLRKPIFRPASNINYAGTVYIFNQNTATPEQLRYFAKAVLQIALDEPRRQLTIGPLGGNAGARAAAAGASGGRGCVGPSCFGSRRKERRGTKNNSGRRTRKNK